MTVRSHAFPAALSVALGSIVFLWTGMSLYHALYLKLAYPPGWFEQAFQGKVVGLEGSRLGFHEPALARLQLDGGGTLTMPRHLGMSSAPKLGQEVLKEPHRATFMVRRTPEDGWSETSLHNGVDDLGYLWLIPAIWVADCLLIGMVVWPVTRLIARRRRDG